MIMIKFLALSESDKRVLIALILIVILVLIIVGYLVKLIKYIVKQQAHYIDKAMYDILDANLITEKKMFFKVAWEKSRRKFYFDARIPMIVLLLSLALILIYQTVIGNYSWEFVGNYLYDASFDLHWPTEKFFGMTLISDWPSISRASAFHFDKVGAWISYIFFITALYGTIHFLVCTCALMARDIYTIKIGNEYFHKDLKDLKQAKLNAKAQAHTKNPSQEMKDYAEGKDVPNE